MNTKKIIDHLELLFARECHLSDEHGNRLHWTKPAKTRKRIRKRGGMGGKGIIGIKNGTLCVCKVGKGADKAVRTARIAQLQAAYANCIAEEKSPFDDEAIANFRD